MALIDTATQEILTTIAIDATSFALERETPTLPGGNPLFVCATVEDGPQAWSSPIQIVRER